jgi:hypothetical protein
MLIILLCFVKNLRIYKQKLINLQPDTAIPDPNSTENNSSLAVASNVAGAAASVAESWAGWAVTSITKKVIFYLTIYLFIYFFKLNIYLF